MIFYPKSYFKNITEINADFFQEKHIKAVLLDIDNTLIDKNNNMVEGLEDWIENVKKRNIKFCILSNTNNKKKAKEIANLLDIPYIYFAKKPLKFGFKRAKKILKLENGPFVTSAALIIIKATRETKAFIIKALMADDGFTSPAFRTNSLNFS